MNKHLIFPLFALLVASCSSLKKGEEKQGPIVPKLQAQVKVQEPSLSLDEASKRLKEVIARAKEEGSGAQSLLETDLYLKASDASLHGDVKTALFLYEHLRILQPKDPYLQRKHAVELIRDGQLEKARDILVKLFPENDYDENVGLVLGGVQTALDQKKEAGETYKKVLSEHPKSEEGCIFLAKSYAVDKKYKKANKLLSSCEKRVTGKAIFSYYKGKIELERDRLKHAIKHFKRALKINPSYFQAALGIGLIHEESEEFDKAIVVYKNFLKKSSTSLPILSRLVQLLFTQDAKGDDIIPYAEMLASLDDEDLNLKVRLGILYTDAIKFDKAIAIFKEVLVAVPESDKILYYLGSLYQQVEETDEALTYFSKIPTSSALFHDTQIQMAQILHADAEEGRNKGQSKKVDRFLSFIEDASDEHQGLRVELGVLLAGFYESAGEFSEAIESIEIHSGEKEFVDGHRYYLASLYEKDGSFDKARVLIQSILDKDPENPHALNFLGYSLLERGQEMDKAYQLIKKAVSLKPEDGFIRDSLGWYYYKVGKLKKALTEIQKAWEITKTDPVIAKHLAIVHQDLRNYELAKKFYMEALKNCKTQSEIVEVRKALQGLEELRLPASQSTP